jgi:hypothetical protein
MRTLKWMLTAFLLAGLSAMAQQTAGQSSEPTSAPQQAAPQTSQPADSSPASSAATSAPTTLEQVVDRAISREHALITMLAKRTPLVETYLQNMKNDPQLGPVPTSDHYYFGRIDMGENGREDYLSKGSFQARLMGGFSKLFKYEYNPTGFSWMVFVDRDDFDRAHYDFGYVHREFLGDVRCIVFDVTPKKGSGKGRFEGRIWVEDQDFNIVRMNGTYVPHTSNSYFFHMDSWRINAVPGYWVPAYVYSEEGDFSAGSKDKFAFKAQTRIWGYNVRAGMRQDELTQVLVDSSVKDDSATAQDDSPLQAQRAWQQQAEDNVLERLQNAGLLAPSGDLDKALQTVVNNLEITNNIDLPRPVRTRVLLTSPLETFSVGNTIVLSRGLIDVLPDEASIAMVLSHELAHIVLGHNLGSKFAFDDRMLFSDDATFNNFGFRHVPEEEAAADKKAMEFLKNYTAATQQKMDTAGLFLRELSERGPSLAALLTPHLGNGFVDNKGQLIRFNALAEAAPKLDPNKLDQIAALPLGGRVKMAIWNDDVQMVKAPPTPITSARDKMPLEVTPFFPRLTRITVNGSSENTTAATNQTSKNN